MERFALFGVNEKRLRMASRWFWSLCHGKSDDRKPNCADPGYCALSGLQTGSITLQMRSKRRKVRGHRAIAPFSDVGRIIDDRYPASVSSSCSGKAIVCRVELLNGGFRAAAASTRS